MDNFHPRLTAVLGPTNTGKTHYAIERLLGHRTGVIGLPLRLLAREVYERVARLKGEAATALVTGEEKIVPPRARYFICTVEAMPPDLLIEGRRPECLVVDEIQLAGHPERGHVFTDRLLHARGAEETLFLGAETIKPLITMLAPGIEILTRPRLSTLSYTGFKKAARLPPRSAIVAFSASEVYRIAEFVRQNRGGTAVVLGALSPRTRNAQVALFESGEVDYLVATDAIGMGLNLDIAHVAFARDYKFDGRGGRRLTPEEVGQIAGRAGRHMRDGSFGATFDLPGFDDDLVAAIEEHRFDPLTRLYWRNSDLDFASPEALLKSLDRRCDRRAFIQMQGADDQLALATLARRLADAKQKTGRDRTRLLWEVCQIPDFRKTLTDDHFRLLGDIFGHLSARRGQLPADWVRGEIARLDHGAGTIDVLTAALAAIRTWTYVTAKPGWCAEGPALHEEARAAENHVSDALHAALSERFVDRRSALLVRSTAEKGDLLAGVRGNGEVVVEGHVVGTLRGFTFALDEAARGADRDIVARTAQRALVGELAARVAAFVAEPNAAISLGLDGRIFWRDAAIARLTSGAKLLEPAIALIPGHALSTAQAAEVQQRLRDWLKVALRQRLQVLYGLVRGEEASADASLRGIAFVLLENHGLVAHEGIELTQERAQWLQSRGVTIGHRYLYMKGLLKPETSAFLALLWNVQHNTRHPVPKPNRASMPARDLPGGFLRAVGYPVIGSHAVRIDRLDELAAALESRGIPSMKEITKRLTCTPKEAHGVIAALTRSTRFQPLPRAPDHGFRQSPFAGLGKKLE